MISMVCWSATLTSGRSKGIGLPWSNDRHFYRLRTRVAGISAADWSIVTRLLLVLVKLHCVSISRLRRGTSKVMALMGQIEVG